MSVVETPTHPTKRFPTCSFTSGHVSRARVAKGEAIGDRVRIEEVAVIESRGRIPGRVAAVGLVSRIGT
jgi:hypothetical protein